MTTPSAGNVVDMAGEVGYALRLPKDLKDRLERLAKREDRSLNAQIVRVLREWADREDPQAVQVPT